LFRKWLKMVLIRLLRFGGVFGLRFAIGLLLEFKLLKRCE
jgi:hypothetical protein